MKRVPIWDALPCELTTRRGTGHPSGSCPELRDVNLVPRGVRSPLPGNVIVVTVPKRCPGTALSMAQNCLGSVTDFDGGSKELIEIPR